MELLNFIIPICMIFYFMWWGFFIGVPKIIERLRHKWEYSICQTELWRLEDLQKEQQKESAVFWFNLLKEGMTAKERITKARFIKENYELNYFLI